MSLSLSRKRRHRESSIGSDESQERENIPPKRSNIVEITQRCGKLIRMHLTNFMCHANLSIDFHSRVNFLVGSNGSGKSAVLAALVLGLGASARNTNRSKNAKAFIKTGEQTAKIEIVIANDGPQPYEPEVYGDKIIVVRTISVSSGSYVLKNSHGHVVSKKVDDLHRLLMFHNIQVDNPVFVLNQDSAREFLKDLEPSKNYVLFLKATQIDIVNEKLNDSLQLHKSQIAELKNFKIKLQKETEDIAEHKEKLKELLSFEKLKDFLKEAEIQHDWLLVKQCESQFQELNAKIDKYEKKKKELYNLIHNKNEVNILLNQEIKENESVIATKNADYEAENKLGRNIKIKVDEINNKLLDIQITYDSLKKKKGNLESDIEQAKRYIEERSKGNQEDVEAQRMENQNLIREYRDQVAKHLDPMIENLTGELRLQIDSKSQKEQVVSEIKRRQNECLDEIRLKKAQICNVKASVENKMLIYGNHMPQLLKEIRNAHVQRRFSKLPRGPIGSYLDVPNSQFRNAVENILGAGLLGSFIVNNTKDRLVLEKILAQFCPKRPAIITCAFADSVYNISQGSVRPPSDTSLLMQEIKCADAAVMNCLIDCMQIERILLTNNKVLAEQLTSVRSNVPRNLRKIYVLKEGNMILEYHPMPKYRMYSSKMHHANFIQVNVEERIRYLENEKLSLENKCKTLTTDLNHIGQQIPQNIKLIHEKRQVLDQHESSKKELLDKITELENIEYADYTTGTNLLKREMDETTERLVAVEKRLLDKNIELSKAKRIKESLEQELKEKDGVLQEIRNEIETFQNKVDQLKMKLRSTNNNDVAIRSKLKELEEVITKLKNDQEDFKAKLKKYIDAATQKGERVDSDLSINEIQDKIGKIKAKLKHGKPINHDPQSMRVLIANKEEALETSQGTFDNIKSSIDSLRKSLKFRFDFLKKLKEHMALLLQLSFSMILRLRNFEGNLDVNHQEKTLTISVIPRDHNKNAVSSTKSLSGGERSYSTVAFLISLWSCVDHPFYFLDEYDVFTDEVNREYMTRLLVKEGRNRPLRQYTFLTPQDMTLMSESFIKILRLGGPERS